MHHVCQFLEKLSVIMTFLFYKRPCTFGEEGEVVCECVLAKFQ